MKKLFKGLGFLALALSLSVASSAGATSTYSLNNIAETGALTVTSAGALSLVAGANAINIGADATAKTTSIATGAAAEVVIIGSNNGASSMALSVGTGNFTLNGNAASTYAIGGATTTGTITIGGASQTGVTTLQSAAATTTAVALTDTAVTSGTALLVTGSAPATMTVAGSFLKVNDGTSNVFRVGYNGHLSQVQATPPAMTGTAGTTTVVAGSSDTRGQIATGTVANGQTIIATFNKTYATAPFCTVTPTNAAGTADWATTSYTVSSTAITVLLTTVVPTTTHAYVYTCIE